MIFNFNPRTLHGIRLNASGVKYSIDTFQSTHHSWGATNLDAEYKDRGVISIHAPLTGCDAAAMIPAGAIEVVN